ncbi:hypothetical protein ABZ934_17640 [Streptomyces sp. NPDC046557]|uniref:hypothetical protein n=1 Tax=Streptomyces sp. NPDC046557 TaxID=3155372 RepID=UPI0033BFC7D8
MGFTSAWAISGHTDDTIAELTPRLLPALRADSGHPDAQRRWRQWQRAPLPDRHTWHEADRAAVDSFYALTAPGHHLDDVCAGITDPTFYVVDDVWEGQEQDGIFVSIHRKDYAVTSLFHAIGPTRAALLPGWCGNFLLTAAQVHQAQPRVERALTFTPPERASPKTGTGSTTRRTRKASSTAPSASGAPPPRATSASAAWRSTSTSAWARCARPSTPPTPCGRRRR